MKRRIVSMIIAVVLLSLCACGTAGGAKPAAETAPIAPSETSAPAPTPAEETPKPTEPPAPADAAPLLPATVDGWAGPYLDFLENNFDILAALWPEGLTGVGFIDLDLDGTPEMILFDQGVSATLGAQLFDCVDGQVYCVSSVLESARGAFDGDHLSDVSVCTSYFEAFRLCRTEEGFAFWVSSANGTMETSWDELVTFRAGDGVLTPVSVCSRRLEIDPETGLVVEEAYTVGGESADAQGYASAAAAYTEAADMGYEGKGVFLWNDMQRYDTTCEGLLAMAQDAAEAYVPLR